MSPIRPISAELAKVAKEQLHEDVSQLDSHLLVVKRWLKELTSFEGTLEDQNLISFLRGCKFSLEKTKDKLRLFFWIRTELPEVIQNRDPLDDRVQEIIRLGVGTPLPITVNPTDPKIFIIRVAQFDYTKFVFADVIKAATLINDVLMRDDDQMVICGMALIIDMADVTAGHLFQFEFSFLKQVAILYQDASPLRMQGIHILNPPPGVQSMVGLFNSLLSPKNKDRKIFVHGTSLESLHEYFHKSTLPLEYGGTLEPIQTYVDQWERRLKDNREYLLKMAELRDRHSYENNLKPPQSPGAPLSPTSGKSHFGLDGSFRKLELD
ncbi:retinol-binding protein pinta-like [Uranotaenia lowii]|uniref:retinol-binding protein pinta-like n=1 Tax=Uranotaenia lowii TaxID=190385 RepID=UPI002478E572|nr:retinol-binding protein pinta-like [Uranotaenia lowii]